jgi:hypothetical protein
MSNSDVAAPCSSKPNTHRQQMREVSEPSHAHRCKSMRRRRDHDEFEPGDPSATLPFKLPAIPSIGFVEPRTISIARLRRTSHSSRSLSVIKAGIDGGGAEGAVKEPSNSPVAIPLPVSPLAGREAGVAPRTISIARFKRTSHSSRPLLSSGARLGTDVAGNAAVIGSDTAGGNALSGPTNSGWSQSEHRNPDSSWLGSNVVLPNPDCPNRNSAPQAIQRIALSATTSDRQRRPGDPSPRGRPFQRIPVLPPAAGILGEHFTSTAVLRSGFQLSANDMTKQRPSLQRAL